MSQPTPLTKEEREAIQTLPDANLNPWFRRYEATVVALETRLEAFQAERADFQALHSAVPASEIEQRIAELEADLWQARLISFSMILEYKPDKVLGDVKAEAQQWLDAQLRRALSGGPT